MDYNRDTFVLFSPQEAETKDKLTTKSLEKSEDFYQCGLHSNFIKKKSKKVSKFRPAVTKGAEGKDQNYRQNCIIKQEAYFKIIDKTLLSRKHSLEF